MSIEALKENPVLEPAEPAAELQHDQAMEDSPQVSSPENETPKDTTLESAASEMLQPEEEPGVDFLAAVFDDAPSSEDSKSEEVSEDPVADQSTSSEPSEYAKEEELPDTWDQKSKTKWGELRRELYEERDKVKALESELQEKTSVSAAEELSRQLEEASDKISQFEQELAVVRVERSPEYQEVVTKPLDAIMQATKNLADRHELRAQEFFDVYADFEDPSYSDRLSNLVKDMSEPDRIRAYRMAEDSQTLFKKSEDLQRNAAQALAEVEAREARAFEEASQQEALAMRKSVERVFEAISPRLPNLGDSVDLNEMKTSAHESGPISQYSSDQQAYSVVAGTLLPKLVKTIQADQAELASLREELKSLKKASPTIDPQGVTPTTNPKDGNTGFLEALFS